MRLLIALAALTLLTAQPASALTVCPTSQFSIAFEPGSATLTNEGRETLAASVNRANQCERKEFLLFADGNDPLGVERARLVRSELRGLGVAPETSIQIGIDEASPTGEPVTPDQIVVFIHFQYD